MSNRTQAVGSAEREFLPVRTAASAAPDVSGLFPDGVLTLCEHRYNWSSLLTPDERQQLGDVCEKRFAEFAAGRSQARQLISALTGTAEPLLIGDYRQPLWPQRITGSISHSDQYCVVAVARRSVAGNLGIDVDTSEALDDGVLDVVLTPAERAAVADLDDYAGKLIFSIKESNYKCCYHMVRAFIGYQQCEVSLDPDSQTFSAVIRCNDSRGTERVMRTHGKWMLEAGHIFTSAILV